MTELKPGMDHALYPFSPLPTRPALHWPEKRALAMTVFLYLEHWELDPPAGTHRDPRFRDPFGDFKPDYRTYTWREYGNRVGIFRLMDLLDRLRLPVTVCANSSAVTRYPYLVEECLRRGYSFAAHATHATRMVTSRMSPDEEAALVGEVREAIARATGKVPGGWVAQDYSETTHTARLLAEEGFDYMCDWPNDDQPFWMNPGPGIVSLPNQSEWDDVQLMWHRRLLATRYPDVVRDAATTLHADAVKDGSGRFMAMHVHPWLSGMPHRFRYVAAALEQLSGMENVWWASADAIAAHAREYIKPGATDASRSTAP